MPEVRCADFRDGCSATAPEMLAGIRSIRRYLHLSAAAYCAISPDV